MNGRESEIVHGYLHCAIDNVFLAAQTMRYFSSAVLMRLKEPLLKSHDIAMKNCVFLVNLFISAHFFECLYNNVKFHIYTYYHITIH